MQSFSGNFPRAARGESGVCRFGMHRGGHGRAAEVLGKTRACARKRGEERSPRRGADGETAHGTGREMRKRCGEKAVRERPAPKRRRLLSEEGGLTAGEGRRGDMRHAGTAAAVRGKVESRLSRVLSASGEKSAFPDCTVDTTDRIIKTPDYRPCDERRAGKRLCAGLP